MKGFHHRHLPDARHDFMTQHPDDFLTLISSDIAADALDQHAAEAYIKNHPCPKQYEPSTSGANQAEHNSRRLSQHEKRQQRLQAMPKHFYVNDQYKTSLDSGDCAVSCCRQPVLSCLVVLHHFRARLLWAQQGCCREVASLFALNLTAISCDAGLVNPAAVELQPYGWLMIVMHYKGCFGSDCILQVYLRRPLPDLLISV